MVILIAYTTVYSMQCILPAVANGGKELMKTKALILGCSHAAGAQMHTGDECTIRDPIKQVIWEAENSYPVQLARMLGYVPLNHSLSGGSNDAMFRICTEQIHNVDIVIACWTGWDRTELWHTEHAEWFNLNYSNEVIYKRKTYGGLLEGQTIPTLVDNNKEYHAYGKQWLIYEGGNEKSRLNKIKNVLALNALAKQHGIEVLNFDSFQGIYDFKWPGNVYRPVPNQAEEFCSWCFDKGFATEGTGHFFLDAHTAYAKYLVDICK